MKVTQETTLPEWEGEEPVNYTEIRQSFALALISEGVPKETTENVLRTVDEAIVNNEQKLVWGKHDGEMWMSCDA